MVAPTSRTNELQEVDEIEEMIEELQGNCVSEVQFGDDSSNIDVDSIPSGIDDLNDLVKNAGKGLYPGCKDFTALSFVVKLLQIKCQH